MDNDAQTFFESGTEIITDPKEQAEKDVEENTATEELIIDGFDVEDVSDED
jgi:hypothetical protein